jgi:gag-polypeptide of LTR copia-type
VIIVIVEKETTKEAWETIKQISVGEDRVRKARARVLKRQYNRMIMSETASICDFSQNLMSIVGEIRSLCVEVKESIVVEKLFSVVSDIFMPIIGTIEQWGDTSVMSVAEAVGRLRVFEESLKGRQQHKEEDEKLMLTRSQWEAHEDEKLLLTRSQWEALELKERRSEEGSNKKEGELKREIEKKPYRKFDKSKIKCFNCSIYGHFALECRKSKKERVNLVEKEEEEPALLMHELVKTQKAKGVSYTDTKKSENLHMGVSAEIEENTWHLNSRASNHMTGCRKHLTNFDTAIQGSVRLEDGIGADRRT